MDVTEEMAKAVETVRALGENFRIPALVDFILGRETKEIKDFGLHRSPYYAFGKERDKSFWQSVLRQAVLKQYLVKDIELYGVIKLGPEAQAFLADRRPVAIAINRDFGSELAATEKEGGKDSSPR